MDKTETRKKAEEYARRLEEEDAARRQAEREKDKPHYNLFHPQSMTAAQRKNLYLTLGIVVGFFTIFLIVCASGLIADKQAEQQYWDNYMQDFTAEQQAIIDTDGKDATEVTVAIDVEEIRAIDMKNSNYKMCLNVGYIWEGHDDWDFSDMGMVHFYKGDTTACGVDEDFRGGVDRGLSSDSSVARQIKESGKNYQNVYYEVTVSKDYWTSRFPLESHQLRFFIVPSDNIDQIKFKVNADESFASPYMNIRGYEVVNFGVNEYLSTTDKHLLNPVYDSYDTDDIYTMEVMGQLEVNAKGLGTYVKCFIALFGTLVWILMCLYVCTYRRVDSLSLTGSAFFGAVSNIVVSAALLPDALQMGLVEYVNIFGIAVIVTAALLVIRINNFRGERDQAHFAKFYGKVMFWTLVVIVVVCNVALPMAAWRLF